MLSQPEIEFDMKKDMYVVFDMHPYSEKTNLFKTRPIFMILSNFFSWMFYDGPLKYGKDFA